MFKQILRTGALTLMAGALAGLPLQLRAQTSTNKPAVTKPASKAAPGQSLPLVGNIAAVNKVAKTITVGKRVFQVTSETRILKADKKTPAVFDDAVVGEHITGSYSKADDEKLTAKSLYLGTASESKPAPAPAKTPAPAPKSK